MKQNELNEILKEHKLWLETFGVKGKQANFFNADLRYADLRDADLKYAVFYGANLRNADLSRGDFTGANFGGANLKNADLVDANLNGALLPHFQIPQTGSLQGYKKLGNNLIAHVLIPKFAQRTACLKNRKCRAELVITLEIFDNFTGERFKQGRGCYDTGAIYKVGEITGCRTTGERKPYSHDFRVDCAPGIHFFLTLKEAIEW